MKKLKQLFHEEVELYGAILTEKALQIVEKWLTQKRIEKSKNNETAYDAGQYSMLYELLEELNQQ